MSAHPTTKDIPAFEDVRKSGLQAYWVIRKVLQLMDRIAHKGLDGPHAYAASRTLDEIEKAAADGALASFEKELRTLIKETRAAIRTGQEEFKSWFGSELEKKLHPRTGLRLQGHFPLLHAAFFRIHLDLDAAAVKIAFGPEDEPLTKARLDPDDVVTAVANTQKELEGTRLPDSSFLEKIHSAYDRVLKFGDLRRGERVPILDVLKEFVWLIQSKRFQADPRRENFREYSRVHFSYNLYKLETRTFDSRTLELTVAPREQAARRDQHLWVPSDERGDGTHFAYLGFKEM